MSYVTAALLRAAFGTRELIEAGAMRDPLRLVSESLLDLVIDEGDTSGYAAEEVTAAEAVAAHLASACAQAVAKLDSFFRARWATVALPLADSPMPADVSRLALWLARYFAHADVVEDGIAARRYREALAELRDFARGLTTLGIAEPTAGGGTTPTVEAPDEVFTASLLDLMP